MAMAMAMAMDMAEDVVFSILVRLPVKSLLVFKAVCRSWRSMIESSAFITQHLHHHHHHHHHVDDLDTWNLIAFEPNTFTTRKLVISLLSGNNFQLCHNVKPEFQLDLGTVPTIIAACDGMVCIHHGDYPDISLWNPATTEFTTLPRAPQPLPNIFRHLSFSFGFGYDVITKDYKVVKIFIDCYIGKKLDVYTDVYSLSTNSWRTIDHALINPPTTIMSNPRSSWKNGGIYYWMGGRDYLVNEEQISEYVILYFDFSTEVFGTIAVPDVFPEYEYFLYLGNLRENVACIGCELTYSTGSQVWVLNQSDGVWTRLSTLQVKNSGCLYGMSKNGKIVWPGIINSPKAFLSDPVTHERNALPVEISSNDFQVALYKESLVSIKSAIGASATKSQHSFS